MWDYHMNYTQRDSHIMDVIHAPASPWICHNTCLLNRISLNHLTSAGYGTFTCVLTLASCAIYQQTFLIFLLLRHHFLFLTMGSLSTLHIEVMTTKITYSFFVQRSTISHIKIFNTPKWRQNRRHFICIYKCVLVVETCDLQNKVSLKYFLMP